MKYKVNGKIIDADNELNAVKKYKNSEIDYLIQEENKAVEDYRQAIKNTKDKNELYVLSHILKEETHHIELLENLQKGKVEFNDAIKGKYYFVPDDSYGQRGTDILEIYLTKEEANKIQQTRIYNNERGFLTNSYRSALYYTQD